MGLLPIWRVVSINEEVHVSIVDESISFCGLYIFMVK